MESKIGLVIQFTGIFLIAVMSLFMRRSLKTVAAGYWAIAWASLSVALSSLSFAFNYPTIAKPLFAVYFFAEYFFGLMVIGGCRSLTGDFELTPRLKLLILPFGVIAICLPFLANDFNFIFNLHALLLAIFFATAFFVLRNSKIKSFGWHVISIALAILALDFFHYAAVFTLLQIKPDILPPENYLAFEPLFDLVLEVLLGFGMIIVLLEQVLQDAQKLNEKLEEAHGKLEQIAHIDPLTTAFNRHAFYGFLKKGDEAEGIISGCVGFFDIDDLKPINDHYGHAVGDMAIRAVVSAIRNLMRAEDLIYRWGGDEFFVIMVSMNAEMARERMSHIERMLTDVNVKGAENSLTIHVSFGFNDFSDTSNLEKAITSADEEMYRRKKERKERRKSAPPSVFLSNENIEVSVNR